MEIINRCTRKFQTYLIISIFLYLTIFNSLVLSKGGGGGINKTKGESEGSSESSKGTSSIPISSGDSSSKSSSSSWVFYYYNSGERYCGNLCLFTAILMPIIILLIIGCGIWRCYRIRKATNAEIEEMKKNRLENGDDSFYDNYNNSSPTTPSSVQQLPPPLYHPPSKYSSSDYIPNYYNTNTNHPPAYDYLSFPSLPKDNLNQEKNDSRRKSFDSMEEIKPNKK